MQLGTTMKQYKVLMYMNLRKNQNRTRSFSFNPDENVNICDPTPSIANESMMARCYSTNLMRVQTFHSVTRTVLDFIFTKNYVYMAWIPVKNM